MEWDGQQGFDRIHLDAALGQVIDVGERPGLREVPLSLLPTFLAGVHERDDFHIGIVEVGADVEVVDASEADEGGPDRPIVGTECGALFHSVRTVTASPAGWRGSAYPISPA